MSKLLGSLCVFAAGGMLWFRRHQEGKQRRQLTADLAAALEQMAGEIRLRKTPLHQLLTRVSEGRSREAAAFFRGVAQAMAAGKAPGAAWRREVETLPLSEGDRLALRDLMDALVGDEEGACRGLSMAVNVLWSSLAEMERRRPEEEKRATALCFSAAALLVILLI